MRKYRLSVVLPVLTGFLIFQSLLTGRINKTVSLYKTKCELEQKVISARQATGIISLNKNEIKRLDKELKEYLFSDSTGMEWALLDCLMTMINVYDLRLMNLPAVMNRTEEGRTLREVSVTVEGEYGGMVQFLYSIEHKNKLGYMKTARFFISKERNERYEKKKLLLSFTLVSNASVQIQKN